VLTAALAVVALPGHVGSSTPSPDRPIPVAALQTLRIDASEDRSSSTIGLFDPAYQSASALTPDTRIVERPLDAAPVPARTVVKLPKAQSAWAYKPARYTLAGQATWYGNGTTAMRLPFGTIVVICGAGGCVERTVTDWGPQRASRVVDMAPADFVRTCGCSLGTGIQNVTVRVY
jgi:hypothetical protein